MRQIIATAILESCIRPKHSSAIKAKYHIPEASSVEQLKQKQQGQVAVSVSNSRKAY